MVAQSNGTANGTYANGANGTNGTHTNGSSHTNGISHLNGSSHVNGSSQKDVPIAICGMGLRLAGNLSSPEELWDFLINKQDARGRVPESRYNVSSYHSASKRPGTVATEYGYFLDESVKLGSLDTNRFSLTRSDLEVADPQHRLMLEVVREAFDDAGEMKFKGSSVGCYIGCYAEDWLEMQTRDHQSSGGYLVDGYSDFMLSNRVSYEMDLRGPSMTIRTACSSSLVSLHEACLAIQQGHCESAIVGGSNLILAPGLTAFMSQKGVLSPEGSCKSFSADADGYARGEGVIAVYIKPLDAAIRDGNPIRAVIRSSMANADGRTAGISQPNHESHEAMIRKTYELAGIKDYSKTAFFECHGTGTAVGDPIEVSAVARIFGDDGIHITSIKPNMGHTEGASGLASLVKAVMALENRTIPPNIKFSSPNPKIPFKERKLTVPVEPTPFPEDRAERVSVNSFGLGGSNAHVILESARSHNVPTRATTTQRKSTPQLLLLSAASAPSLQKMTSNFYDLVSKNQEDLEDLAYTLANRREHLSHRSFIIADRNGPSGDPSQGRKIPNPTPDLVMVFTGQGAQWPRMGRDLLLREDLVFQKSIRMLDKHLRTISDAPEWTIEAELLKPARTSRVQQAELSQPLCTAVQIALVDMLAAVDVKPAAVVGHSSGELAAAYAAGALTAREAIIAAFQRGRAATFQNKKGAMAAVGLGWDEVRSFLNPPKVVVACENSPRSVTISGDADEVQATVDRIKEAHPDAMVRLLKVEKAYHSYHMQEVGDQYCADMGPHVVGKAPTVPFFSSVTGAGYPHQEVLGAKYWQKNLESAVLFSAAVSGILEHVKNPAFLEIGPHGALAGPVRQILQTQSAPYVSAMSRGEDCVKSYLTAIGKLFELNITVDLAALMPTGSVLTGLPRYPWDKEVEYWSESRLSAEWRNPQHPSHPILGIRVAESTALEPMYRNKLKLEHVSWLRDHKIEGNVIFPGAGYIAMVGEGIRQITGIDGAYTIRHMILSAALVLPEGSETEILTTFKPHRLTDSLDSKWWDFTISSHNGHAWTKHCAGQVTSWSSGPVQYQEAAPLPRKFSEKKLYDALDGAGIEYGPKFRRLEDLRTGTVARVATAKLNGDWCDDEEHYFIHPSAIDAAFQTGPLASAYGRVHAKNCRMVPTKIDKLTVHRCSADVDMSFSASATPLPGSGDVVGQLKCIVDGKVVLNMQGAQLSLLAEAEATESDSVPITARLTWGPHIDFLDASKLIRPEVARHLYTPTLDELGRLCMVYTQRRIQNAQKLTSTPHMQSFMNWIDRQVQTADKTSAVTHLPDDAIKASVDTLVSQLSDTPVAGCAAALQKVFNNIEGLLSGQKDAVELLLADDTLTQLYIETDAVDRSEFLKAQAHTKPNLRILEIGAGTGASTAAMLKHLVLPVGQPLYSQYTYTDISSGFFSAAKDRFKNYRNIEYRALDISKDPAEQEFGDDKYDLIIATNVLHATRTLQETLKNVHKLLDPNGRLLLQELHSPSKWVNYIFGLFAGWWYGEKDGRPDEPYVAPARWESEFKAAGFSGLDAVVLDGQEPYQLNAMMVASPQADGTPAIEKIATLLCDERESHAPALTKQLQSRGYAVRECRLGEELPKGQDVIALLEGDRPFFTDIEESRLKSLQKVIDNLGDNALVWVTHLTQINCTDPKYAEVVGAARTIRNETLVDFATLEVDDIASSLDTIVDVFAKFQSRKETESLKPDYEFAIVNNTVQIGRIFPFSLEEELLSEPDSQQSVVLDVAKLGRLNTIRWIPYKSTTLVGDDVEVELYATGLNFKDILGALAITPYPQDGLGVEAAGVVCRVGPEVKDLRVGDRIMLLEYGTFASHVITSERTCEKIPDSLSFEDAGSMPAVFTTAIAGLLTIGDLRKGQSVLIHSACGGVGLAAIQLAQMVGAEIYATVGSEEKVQYLMKTFNLPRNRIFNSRDDSFVEGVMRETNGEGVDIALNSLSGELLHATWRCIAEFGKMVDIGKRDFLGAGRLDMDVFLGSRTYSAFYLDLLLDKRKSAIKELMQTLSKLLKLGLIEPITPRKVYDASAIEEAFRFMQQGQHLGKLVISMRGWDGHLKMDAASVKSAQKLALNSSASYLLIGGLGGLGRSVARHLADHGARRLVFLSRSAGSGPEDDDIVLELQSMGVDVRLVKGSVTNKDDVLRAIDQAPNLKGIIQLAMVLRDQNFIRMTVDEWSTTTSNKINGSWNLHNATIAAGIELDFFVLYSSLSGTTGQLGQANYAAASTFLDSFAQYRNALGLSAFTIDIGAVQDVGYVSQNEDVRQRLSFAHSLTEKELLEAVSAAIIFSPRTDLSPKGSHTFTHMNTIQIGLNTTVPLSDPNCRAGWKKDHRMAAYHNISKSRSSTSSGSNSLATFLTTLKSNPALLNNPETTDYLAIEIGKKLFSFLLRGEEDLDVNISLSQLGMDSLVGVEMRSWWKQAFGFDISVLELLGAGNLEGLGTHAVEGLAKKFSE